VTGGESSSTSSVEDLPPSAKYVHHVVDEDGPITRQALLEETWLAESTVDDALRTLENRHLIHRARKSDDLTQVLIESRRSPDV
jgi:DNA-binding MarR family transcriptional regulator